MIAEGRSFVKFSHIKDMMYLLYIAKLSLLIKNIFNNQTNVFGGLPSRQLDEEPQHCGDLLFDETLFDAR